MKNIKYLFLFFAGIITIFYYSGLSASTGSYSQTVSISRHGSSASQVINTAPFGVEKQIYSVDISGNYDGHGALGPSGGKYGISVCINSVGAMWNGSCWNVIDPNGAGNIGDASGSIPGNNVSIGATSNNFNYFSADVYVNDADANVTFTMYGREVSINGFNTTNSTMAVGGQFDITWNATERTGDSVLTYSGPVNCDVADGASVAGDTNGTTCTGTAVGTATFNLQATGYGGYGTKNVNSQPINVNIISPPVSCGNGVIESGEQCDSGANNGSCPRTCSNSCTINSCSGASCGNGVIESGEQCDSGANNGSCPRTCSNSCTINNSCSASTAVVTFTASGPGTALAYSSSAVNQPLVYAGSCRNATCNMTLPVGSYIAVDAVHDVSGGPFVWTPVCPAAGVGNRCYGLLNGNVSGGVTFTGVTTPTTNNVTISSPMVTPNGTTQYTISHTGADTGGSSKITYQYALLRDASGINKGWFAWNNSLDPWSSHKNAMACSGGGYGAILSTSSWAGYGDQYVRLISCSTTTTSNSRTVNFVMVFEPNYTTTLTGNDIYGITYNTNNNYSPWEHFDINFGLNMPALVSATISPSPVIPNNTDHTITVVGTDPSGGSNVTHEYALINHTGTNAGQYRGYITWYIDSNYNWPGQKNKQVCSGGGGSAVLSGYGDTYVTLVSCSTSVSGNIRTTNFVVRFDPSFTSPTTGNLINAYIHNGYGHNTGWVSGSSFDLSVPVVPTVTSPTVSGITTTGATLGAEVTSLGWPASITARGTCWGTSSGSMPNCSAEGGLTTGVYTHARSGMPSNTTIYYQGYATNSTGTGYSPTASFSTLTTGSISASPSSVPPSTNVTVTFTGVSPNTNIDWIGLYRTTDADNAFSDWRWASDCTKVTPYTAVTGTARSSGSCTFTMPATTGDYNFRIFYNNTYTPGIASPNHISNTVRVENAVTSYNLNVTKYPSSGGGGTVTSSPAGINCGSTCTYSYTSGTSVTLTAAPSSSFWKFNSWSGCDSVSGNTCTVNMTLIRTVTANFGLRLFFYKEF